MKKAVLLILEQNDKILFARRAETKESLPGRWSLPSETMKEDELIETATERCAAEELQGIELQSITPFDEKHVQKDGEDKILYFMKIQYTGNPSIKDVEELTELQQHSFEEFFKLFSDEQIGHGLQYLRKKFGYK